MRDLGTARGEVRTRGTTACSAALALAGFLAPTVALSDAFSQATDAPEWSVTCDVARKDAFGDKAKQHCDILLNNMGVAGNLIGNSYKIDIASFIAVDAGGPHLQRPKRSLGCSKGPARIAVDEVRIDRLSDRKQVEAVLSGRLIVWEEQAKWPGCGIAPQASYLAGLPAAYADMMQRWNARPK